ncbi:phosphatidate cytidylyltransferase [Microbacterium binotii]|uniref:Phosphatidate cytidylyltransferase n=1 Tax=Microbacterium binotii TaxID=462710 RepID=A0ABN3PGL8_9MICO
MSDASDAAGVAPESATPGQGMPPGRDRVGAEHQSPPIRTRRNEFELQVAHARAEFEEANERIKQRTGRDLILAIVIGVAIGAVVLVALVFVKWPFLIFGAGVALLGTFEFARALQASGRKVDVVPQLAGGVMILLSAYFLDLWLHWVSLLVAVVLIVVWRLLGQMIARDGRRYAAVVDDVLAGALLPVYVSFLASLALVLLRQEHGEWWVMAFLIVAIASDTGAYVTGLTLGRHPMAPRISPKKTWEGFAGAALAAVVAGILLSWLMLGLPWWSGIIFGLVILGTATAGDLGESMLKRDLGIKDMSSWLPGHGGVLDRLDSILPSAPAALALFYLLTPLAVS